MAKAKLAKTDQPGRQRHIKARIMYLHRLANVLARPTAREAPEDISSVEAPASKKALEAQASSHRGLPFPSSSRLLFEARSIARKSQVRLSSLSPDFNFKHQVCRRCSTPLIPSSENKGEERVETEDNRAKVEKKEEVAPDDRRTCDVYVENRSKGRQKQWADVKVVKCMVCGAEKRWQIGAKGQGKGKQEGNAKKRKEDQDASTKIGHGTNDASKKGR